MTKTTLNPSIGARNLLQNCVQISRGDQVLLLGEEYGIGYYDDQVCDFVAAEARLLGAQVQILRAPAVTGPNNVPESVLNAIERAEHVIFFSRLGDQLRFTPLPGTGTKTMCYALTMAYLSSEFACVPWTLYQDVHDYLVTAIQSAQNYSIHCPLGTALTGEVAATETAAGNDFTVKTFPVVIFPPLTCYKLSGQLVLDCCLMSTSLYQFRDSVLWLEQPLTAQIDNSRIVGFVGDKRLVSRVEQHYQRVAELTGGDVYAINSWHTGIYPKTYYHDDPCINMQRWGDLAFANPRYTHFHTCGDPPGNVASATFDATICFDHQLFWHAGRPVFFDQPPLQALLAHYPDTTDAYSMRWDIGLERLRTYAYAQ